MIRDIDPGNLWGTRKPVEKKTLEKTTNCGVEGPVVVVVMDGVGIGKAR